MPGAVGFYGGDKIQIFVGQSDICVAVGVGVFERGFALDGMLVIPGGDLFAVYGIVHAEVFFPAETGVTDGEVRTHFFDDEHRQYGQNVIFLCHAVGPGIGADGKFSQRQGFVWKEKIFLNVLAVFSSSSPKFLQE